jgi:hypothetical protein
MTPRSTGSPSRISVSFPPPDGCSLASIAPWEVRNPPRGDMKAGAANDVMAPLLRSLTAKAVEDCLKRIRSASTS